MGERKDRGGEESGTYGAETRGVDIKTVKTLIIHLT